MASTLALIPCFNPGFHRPSRSSFACVCGVRGPARVGRAERVYSQSLDADRSPGASKIFAGEGRLGFSGRYPATTQLIGAGGDDPESMEGRPA